MKQDALALPDLASKINTAHRLATEAARSALEHALEAGHLLVEAKSQVEHGEWLPWLKANFEGGERNARNYMRLARHMSELEANRQRSAVLSIDAALKLLAAPEEEALISDADPTTDWQLDLLRRMEASREELIEERLSQQQSFDKMRLDTQSERLRKAWIELDRTAAANFKRAMARYPRGVAVVRGTTTTDLATLVELMDEARDIYNEVVEDSLWHQRAFGGLLNVLEDEEPILYAAATNEKVAQALEQALERCIHELERQIPQTLAATFHENGDVVFSNYATHTGDAPPAK